MDLLKNAVVSWKTTFLGVAGIVAILAKWVKSGVIDANDFPVIYAAIVAILAKDANVTGSVK